MEVEAGVSSQPLLYFGVFVGSVVIDHQMKVQIRRHLGLDVAQKLEKFLMPMAGLALRHDLSALDVERRKQSGRAMAFVVVGYPFHIAQTQRQQRLAALQGLDLALLVYAQHQGMLGRIQIQTDDVAHFLHEERIGGQFEGLLPMGL